MARESCDLEEDETELLKPSSSSSPPPASPPQLSSSSPSPLQQPVAVFAKPSGHDFQAQQLRLPAAAADPSSARLPSRFSNRCSSCRKRVGLTGFRCRCGSLFCPRHRYSDAHDCSFDYKAAGREQISRANPVIRPAKIIKI